MTTLALTNREARRLSVVGQLLSAPRPTSILQVVRELGELQMDPTAAVARTERLVLFSRLGPRFRVHELERLLWDDRALFEYEAHILPTEDYWIHRVTMRQYPAGAASRHRYVRDWPAATAAFRRYVLLQLRARAPPPPRTP